MLLRLRGPDGMIRITIDQNDSVGDLGRQVSPSLRVERRATALCRAYTYRSSPYGNVLTERRTASTASAVYCRPQQHYHVPKPTSERLEEIEGHS